MSALGEGGVHSITFDDTHGSAINVPGTDFSLPRINVPLVPQGMEGVVDYVALVIDVVCTVWVFNMVINRIHALIVGETAVEVVDVDDS